MAHFLKPNPAKLVDGSALKVFDPERKTWLPEDGASVPNSAYWVRRIATGDCVHAVREAAQAPVAAAPVESPKKAPSKKDNTAKKQAPLADETITQEKGE